MEANKLRIKKYINEVVDLIYNINTETKYCGFVDISGHVGWFTVKVAESKLLYNEFLLNETIFIQPEDGEVHKLEYFQEESWNMEFVKLIMKLREIRYEK